MSKVALGVEYSGSDFNGWQSQDHGRTVQQTLEQALSTVANTSIRIQCAGRTDSGVHAVQQVAHMETEVSRDMHSWLLGTNVNLPFDVNLLWAKSVDDEFHARFSALSRTYRYLILNRDSRSSLLHKKVTIESRSLDSDKMALAAEYLIGKHDFSSYRAIGCQSKSPVRIVHELSVKRIDDYIIIDINANAFLQHMVRNIAGVLMEIGMGRQAVEWSKQVLEQRDRTLGGITAPAEGLYLVAVEYPETFSIPSPNPSQWPMCL